MLQRSSVKKAGGVSDLTPFTVTTQPVLASLSMAPCYLVWRNTVTHSHTVTHSEYSHSQSYSQRYSHSFRIQSLIVIQSRIQSLIQKTVTHSHTVKDTVTHSEYSHSQSYSQGYSHSFRIQSLIVIQSKIQSLIQNTVTHTVKDTVTRSESHVTCAVSLLESREQRDIKAMKNKNNSVAAENSPI